MNLNQLKKIRVCMLNPLLCKFLHIMYCVLTVLWPDDCVAIIKSGFPFSLGT